MWNHSMIIAQGSPYQREKEGCTRAYFFSGLMPLWEDPCAGYAPLRPLDKSLIRKVEKTLVTNL